VGALCELADRRGDLRALVRDDSMLHLVLLGLEQLDEQRAALVLAFAGGDSVGDGDDRGFHAGSFVFSTRTTSVTDISESIALAMS
jgi:hypothetical protein